MNRHIVYNLVLIVTLPGCSSTQPAPEDLPYGLGRRVGLDAMQALTDPERNPGFRVGLVNNALQTGMLLGPQDTSKTVQYLRSTEFFLWADAARQITNTNTEYFDFEFRKTNLDAENCPGLAGLLESFYANLEASYSAPLGLSEQLPDISGTTEEIVIDGTRYIIQVMADDTKITLMPNNGRTSALHNAAASLEKAAQNCAASVPGTVVHFYY